MPLPRLLALIMGVARIFFRGAVVQKFSKNSQTKFQKIFKRFSKKFRKCYKVFLRKLIKCIILAHFQQNLENHALTFCAFRRKTQVIGNSEKMFGNFEKIS